MVMVEWAVQAAAVQVIAMAIQGEMGLAQVDKALLVVLAKANIIQAEEEEPELLAVQDETQEMLLVAQVFQTVSQVLVTIGAAAAAARVIL